MQKKQGSYAGKIEKGMWNLPQIKRRAIHGKVGVTFVTYQATYVIADISEGVST